MKKVFLFVMFSLLLQQANATHNMAADISYTHISGNTYKITVRTYTNTNPLTTQVDRCELVIYFGDGDSTLAPRLNGPVNQCTTADGETIATDIKKSIYEATHTYSGNGVYVISIEDPNRISGICNIPNSVKAPFYLQAILKIFPAYGNNSSPQYTGTPMVTDTIGLTSYYTPLNTESDGDSLSYELVTPMGDSMPIYGYTVPDYSNSFSIDSTNGTVTWNAPTMICNYVYAIEIKEWRTVNGVAYHIGSTTQEVWNQGVANTSIFEYSSVPAVIVYPNPSSGSVNFSVPDEFADGQYSLEIISTLGEKIYAADIQESSDVLNIKELSSGTYFFKLISMKGNSQRGTFVVANK